MPKREIGGATKPAYERTAAPGNFQSVLGTEKQAGGGRRRAGCPPAGVARVAKRHWGVDEALAASEVQHQLAQSVIQLKLRRAAAHSQPLVMRFAS